MKRALRYTPRTITDTYGLLLLRDQDYVLEATDALREMVRLELDFTPASLSPLEDVLRTRTTARWIKEENCHLLLLYFGEVVRRAVSGSYRALPVSRGFQMEIVTPGDRVIDPWTVVVEMLDDGQYPSLTEIFAQLTNDEKA